MTKDRFDWVVRNIDFERLSDWETRFLESCEISIKNKGDLTPRMEEILENIHREKT